ncbi:unnamed protein product [Protopolystoma xenopodis]|uniref:Uncharacterized protein n=1 Tax=Protopolystoma xenopodis TaxID=117903 RepID=A0A3S5BU52_9PLAT|nr:unnamed protein product [Protopolystoma xenopodis]
MERSRACKTATASDRWICSALFRADSDRGLVSFSAKRMSTPGNGRKGGKKVKKNNRIIAKCPSKATETSNSTAQPDLLPQLSGLLIDGRESDQNAIFSTVWRILVSGATSTCGSTALSAPICTMTAATVPSFPGETTKRRGVKV